MHPALAVAQPGNEAMNRHRSLIRRQFNFSLSIPMQFDKAIRLALKVKPEGGSKKKRRHRARKTKSAA